MAEFSEHSGYTLDDLVGIVSRPWYEFAAWGDEHLPELSGGFRNKKLGRFNHGYHWFPPGMGFGCPEPNEWPDWAVLACHHFRSALFDFGGRADRILANVAGFEWPAKGGPRKDITFEAYARKVILDHKDTLYPLLRELVRWVKGRRPFDNENWGYDKEPSFFPADTFTKYGARHQQIRWSRWVVRGPFNHERAFWNLVRNALRDDLKQFQTIQAAIREGRPLTNHEHALLIMYQALGTLRTIQWVEPEGAISIGTVLEADWGRLNAGDEEMRAQCLLVPVAYQLAVDWERSQPWPRHVVTCRNPLCGRLFYSGHASAKTCPRPPQSGRRSDCKAVWEAYQKWLRKGGGDPEKHWADKKLAEAFCRQFKPRDAQANLR